VPNFNFAIALIILVENVLVALGFPPRAQLAIPAAVERVKKLWVLKAEQSEKILITQMTFE